MVKVEGKEAERAHTRTIESKKKKKRAKKETGGVENTAQSFFAIQSSATSVSQGCELHHATRAAKKAVPAKRSALSTDALVPWA
jgi:hypothetical protein